MNALFQRVLEKTSFTNTSLLVRMETLVLELNSARLMTKQNGDVTFSCHGSSGTTLTFMMTLDMNMKKTLECC
jgi:hypothetical protein